MGENFGLDKVSNSVSDFAGGFGEAFRTPYDGARQLAGAQIDPHESKGGAAEMAGRFAGGSVLFIGSMMLAKRLPVIGNIAEGKVASILAGGTLGFLTPVGENQGMGTHLMNAGLGAGTMSLMEFGPGALGKMSGLQENTLRNGLIKYGAANGAAGLVNTEGASLINTGHSASAQELMMGAGTWGLMGATFHAAGRPFERMAAEQKAAQELTAQRPWQFKDVQDIHANDLRPGQQLAAGHYRVNFDSQGQQRTFNLYVSEGASKANGDAPVVTFLHGLTPKGTADHIIRELSFNRFADENGAVVAYLEGMSGHKGPLTGNVQNWKDTNFGYTKHPAQVNDNQTFGDMMRVIRDHVPQANTDNIAVTGFSLGGKMANRLAATRPEISALGTIHGTVDKFDLEIMHSGMNRRPLDAIFVLGDKDRVLPLNGGRSIFTALLENAGLSKPRDQAGFWSKQLGESSEPFVTQAPEYVRRDWMSPGSQTRVTEYVVKDGAHAIDGAHAKKNAIQWLMGVPKPDNYFDARRRTWNFVIDALERNNVARSLDAKPVTKAATA